MGNNENQYQKNQAYTIEEKTGKIVKIEEANEKQKQQKKRLKVAIASLCSAITIGTVALLGVNYHQLDENSQVATETIAFNNRNVLLHALISSGLTEEEAKRKIMEAEEIVANEQGAYTERNANIGVNYNQPNEKHQIATEANNSSIPFTIVLDDSNTTPTLYQKEIRQVTTDGEGNYQYGDWVKTDEYVMDYLAPNSSLDTRYVAIGLAWPQLGETTAVIIYQEEEKINNDWVKGNLVFTRDIPQNSESKRFVCIGAYTEEEINTMQIYREETTKIFPVEGSNHQFECSGWMATNNYVIDYKAPADNVSTRYVLLGTIANVMNGNIISETEQNMDSNAIGDVISSGRTK